jgi:lipoprotein NlpI
MNPLLKFAIALVVTLAFFLVWDRAEIESFRATSNISSGLAAEAKRNLEGAIRDFNEAVRLDPQHVSAYLNRGNIYQTQGELDRAIADYDEVIRLSPRFATAYYQRGNAFSSKGDFERAISDYSQIIRLHPKHAAGFANRGRAYFYAGSLANARADFAKALTLDPKHAYAGLWLDIAERRDHLPSQLPQLADQLDMTVWPGPIVKLFLGELSADAVLAKAADPNPEVMQGQVCEAHFYAAELALLKPQTEEALQHLRLAASGCPRSFIEWRAANAELSRLNQ